MSGWIKLHRSITEHWLYTEKRIFSKFEAWNDILLTVNFAETQCCIKGKVYTVKRGESILSFDSWGKRWGWDKSKVRRFFSLLKSDNMIELKSDNITTHLTVCKYDTYQDNGNTDETPKARKRNANEYQTTPREEGKKERREERKNNIEFIPPTLEEVYEYFREKGHSQHTAQTAFYYYQNLNWFDSNDKKIVNWKNKMLSVWMKEETKIKPKSNEIVFPR